MSISSNASLYFTEEELSFILNMARQCADGASSRLTRSAILRTMIRLLQLLEVDLSGVRTEDQLLEHLQSAIQAN